MPRQYGVTNNAPWSAAPAVGPAGDTYFNTANKNLYISDGTTWLPVSGGGYYRVMTFSWALVSGAASGPAGFTTVVDGGTTLLFSDYGTCTSAGAFIAPVNGIYSFHVNCDNLLTAANSARLAITRNGTTIARSIYTAAGGGVNAYSVTAPNI